MTREEAIQRFQQMKKILSIPNSDAERTKEAIDMAIEALNREQKKYDAICDEFLELKSDLNLPIEVAMAYEKSIGVVSKYAKMGDSE